MGWFGKPSSSATTPGALRRTPSTLPIDVMYTVSTWDSQWIESLQKLRACFREYQLLFRFFISWSITSNAREGASQLSLRSHLQRSLEEHQFGQEQRNTLESFVNDIDELIEGVSKTIRGSLPRDGGHFSVKWVSQKDQHDLASRIYDSVYVAHLPGLTLSLKGKFTSTIEKRIDKFRSALDGIETLLKTRTGRDVQITSHTGDLLDIVGWSLDTKISIEALKPSIKTQAAVGNEAGFEKHPRKEVNRTDFLPGGPFQGVIKLLLYFEQRSGATTVVHGTAFLLDNYTVATAGHCVYDWRFDQLCAIEAFVAYATPDEQSRRGTHVAVHWGWFKAFDPAYDLACIRLDEPFGNTHPMKICRKPMTGSGDIQIPGFDNTCNSRMHSSSCNVSWPAFESNLLSHEASTHEGSSGSPVITENGVVALHRGSKCIGYPGQHSEVSNEAVFFGQESNKLLNISNCLKGFATSEKPCSEMGKYGSVCRYAQVQNDEKTKDIHMCLGKANPLGGRTDPTSGMAT